MKTAVQARTNEQWLAELQADEPDGRALEDLRAFLRRSLAKALRARASLDESDLDDFTQDALLRILAGLSRFRADSRFTTWATAVAIRTAFSALRRRTHQHRSLDELDFGRAEPVAPASRAGGEPGQALDQQTLYDALRRAINEALTQKQRTVVLGELAGVPTEVLVEKLDTNPNALYKLHHDARKKLKRALNEAGYSDEDVRLELLAASEGS